MSIFLANILVVSLVVISGVLNQSESASVFGELDGGQELNESKVQFFDTYKHVFYWLFTRDNSNGQKLKREDLHMIESTTYNAKNPTKVLIHGWLSTTQEKEGFCRCTVNAYLKTGNYNVICVEWKSALVDSTYYGAYLRTKHIAKDIANVLNKITYNMTKVNDGLHLVGHSMGAHIAGFTGKEMPKQISRITALDPARPLFEHNLPPNRLVKTDAFLVDVIHTNGDQNGILPPFGHIDYFPNGGKYQPSCKKTNVDITGSCSHTKSYQYFAHSIWAMQDYKCYKCRSWDAYVAGKCNAYSTFMGEHVDKRKSGTWYLETNVEDKCFNHQKQL